MKVKPSQAVQILEAFLKAKIVPMLEGPPGIGKSGIIQQLADSYNLKVIDFRLSQCDPPDLLGLPQVKSGRGSYAPMDTFSIEGDSLPDGYSGWLLFLDEFNSAKEYMQAAAYKLILDRMVGQHRLHPNVAIIAAGNREEDNAIVNPISTAMRSRLAWLELTVDHEEWCDWAMVNGIDHRITDFIKFKPSALYTFDPEITKSTYASPRTWEFANRLMPYINEKNFLYMLAGTISEGVAREFISFCKLYTTLPKMQEIKQSPTTVQVPSEPSVLYALTGAIANHVTEDSIDSLMDYIKRMPTEFQVLVLKESNKRNPKLTNHKTIRTWSAEVAGELY